MATARQYYPTPSSKYLRGENSYLFYPILLETWISEDIYITGFFHCVFDLSYTKLLKIGDSAGYALCNPIKSGEIQCNSPRPTIPIPNEESQV